MDNVANYQEWLKTVPEDFTGDVLWKMVVYRYALFLADLAWHDCTKLMKDQRTVKLSDQLYEAVGSIGSNISEGYSRSLGRDRARFYEYGLGSARESRGWYYDVLSRLAPRKSTFAIKDYAGRTTKYEGYEFEHIEYAL